MKVMLLACVAWLLSTTAHAENGKDFAMQGVGTSTCTQFANLYKSDAQYWEAQFFAWAQGFMSGNNFAQVSDNQPYTYLNLGSLDTKAQQASIRRYCDQHPLGSYLDAVENLMTQLEMKTFSPRPK
jgi:hypothetical protein